MDQPGAQVSVNFLTLEESGSPYLPFAQDVVTAHILEHKDDVEYLEDDNDEEYLEDPDNKGFLDNNANARGDNGTATLADITRAIYADPIAGPVLRAKISYTLRGRGNKKARTKWRHALRYPLTLEYRTKIKAILPRSREYKVVISVPQIAPNIHNQSFPEIWQALGSNIDLVFNAI